MRAEDYNYRSFPADDDPVLFPAYFEHLKPGEAAPDGSLIDIDSGEAVSLESIYGQHTFTVIELGSFT
jgi:hypothetical protein